MHEIKVAPYFIIWERGLSVNIIDKLPNDLILAKHYALLLKCIKLNKLLKHALLEKEPVLSQNLHPNSINIMHLLIIWSLNAVAVKGDRVCVLYRCQNVSLQRDFCLGADVVVVLKILH